ncbi:MAG: hypothetical protein KDA24_06220 [Deltaproteobacteria bacterium]|nr:hypothetical protein [Deltaproteobacteria bacterium]
MTSVRPPTWATAAVGAVVTVQLAVGVWGWSYWRLDPATRGTHANAELLEPAGGVGQLLGMAGLLLILVSLLYSLRKLLPLDWALPPPASLLWLHAAAGTLGPVFVLQHCGGRFEGLPGVAAVALLLVTGGGLLGRFFYGRLPARAAMERDRSQLPTSLLLRASVGALPERPKAPDPAVVDAVGHLQRMPVGTASMLALPWYEMKTRRVEQAVVHSLAEARVPGRVRTVIQEELFEAIRARRGFVRAESVRRTLRWWRITHVALSHAMVVLALLHAGLAITYSGTVGRILGLFGG